MNYPIQVLTKERDDLQFKIDNYFYGKTSVNQEEKLKIVQLNKAIETLTNIENGNI
jgi:hypothetical protein